jgi:hypothetical protein
MNIKSFYGLAVVGLFVCSCQSDSYKVQGFAHDFAEGDTIFLKASDNSSEVCYTLIEDGKFYFMG